MMSLSESSPQYDPQASKSWASYQLLRRVCAFEQVSGCSQNYCSLELFLCFCFAPDAASYQLVVFALKGRVSVGTGSLLSMNCILVKNDSVLPS